MKNRINIVTAAYFPWPFITLGMLILITVGVWLSGRYGPLGLLLIPMGIFVFAAHYRLVINLTSQTYHDYLWIVGIKSGTKEAFSSIGGLHLTSSAYRQTFSNFTSSTTKRGTEYNGYIQLDGQNVHLFSDTSKRKVMKKLRNIQNALQGNTISSTELIVDSSITDYTEEQ